jgi:hypothetical protein
MSQPNAALTEEESAWVAQFAGRLLMIRADAAGLGPEKRREFLHEEITRSLKDVPSATRKRYLEALVERFPVAGQILSTAPAAGTAVPSAAVNETPETLLERFLDAVAAMPEERQAAFAARIAEAGLARASAPAPGVLEVPEETQRALGLTAGQQPRLDRLSQLANVLVEVICVLDQTALKTLGQLSARSALLRRSEDFRKAAAKYLVGESETLDPQMRALSGLMGALLAAMLAGAKDFEREHIERFSPGRIADAVEAEGGGGFMGPNKKERCWKKYEELAEDYSKPGFIDRRIKDCLGAFVEKTARKP